MRTELLNYGRDGEVDMILSRVRRRGGLLNLAPGQNTTGYGAKIATDWVVRYAGRIRRVYCTCFSNAGTCWFRVKGRKMIVG